MSNRITIEPVTRLEGHGKIEIFLDKEGNVENAYLQIPEVRGFEQFCIGRPVEDMPTITNRICGVCPEAHHLAAVKALDNLFGVTPPPAAKKLRELLYSAFFVTDHTTHFYVLGGPDFIIGPDAPPKERNIFGVIKKVGIEIGSKVIDCRARNARVIEILGARGIHPTGGVPGGWSKALNEEERKEIEDIAKKNVEFALFTLKIFDDIVLKNKAYLDLITSDVYTHKPHYMGTVDENNKINFYDGKIRVVNPDGEEVFKYNPVEYTNYIAERVEPWSYIKFPYLKKIGWKGFIDGSESGIYCCTPLSRLNASDGITTPLAQENFEKMYEYFGSKKNNGRYQPIHHQLATHWARVIELLYAAEKMLLLAQDKEITSRDIRVIPNEITGEGVGSVEAPRGTLTHHYISDKNGILTKVNLVVGTTNNAAPISMSIKRAAKSLIKKGSNISEATLNMIEMAFRLYDPCFSCATHSIGKKLFDITIHDSDGNIIERLKNE
jgi:F420-non-reducing hydrogenase large subunit